MEAFFLPGKKRKRDFGAVLANSRAVTVELTGGLVF